MNDILLLWVLPSLTTLLIWYQLLKFSNGCSLLEAHDSNDLIDIVYGYVFCILWPVGVALMITAGTIILLWLLFDALKADKIINALFEERL